MAIYRLGQESGVQGPSGMGPNDDRQARDWAAGQVGHPWDVLTVVPEEDEMGKPREIDVYPQQLTAETLGDYIPLDYPCSLRGEYDLWSPVVTRLVEFVKSEGYTIDREEARTFLANN